MTFIERLYKLLEAPLAHEGLGVVRIQISQSRRPVLEILIEPLDHSPLSLDQCAKANRLIAALLDVEDIVKNAYILEVSSPGVDRPLIREADYVRFQNEQVKLETAFPLEGRRKFQGVLKGYAEGIVQLQIESQVLSIPLEHIIRCKIIPNWEKSLRKKP